MVALLRHPLGIVSIVIELSFEQKGNELLINFHHLLPQGFILLLDPAHGQQLVRGRLRVLEQLIAPVALFRRGMLED